MPTTRAGFVRNDYSWDWKRIFHYHSGATERAESVILDPATITANAQGVKYLRAGTLIAKITATGAYGPFASGATDGRQTIPSAQQQPPFQWLILEQDIDVTDGPVEAGGLYAGCDFEWANLTMNGATLAQAQLAFGPTVRFF